MVRTSIGSGLYESEDGYFWRRCVNPTGGRTWKKLAATTEDEAKVEIAGPITPRTVSDLLVRYCDAGMPTARGRERASRQTETYAVHKLGESFMASMNPSSLSPAVCARYGLIRKDRPRLADVELQVLSNAINWAVGQGLMDRNPIRGRTRIQDSADVRHCRECMPANADELHRIARELFKHPLSEAAGWQCILEAFTGCRGNEILGLRMDAKVKTDPGWIEGDYLYIRRAKGGQWPYVPIHTDLRAAIDAHHAWHDGRSPWWIPGASLVQPLHRTTLTIRLSEICKRLGIRQVTSHGLRAYFVTVMRSHGRRDEEVAALIGDRTVELIRSTYGELPEVWSGGEPLGFVPKDGTVAWDVLT